jgi:hypothetical protein
MIIFYRPSTLLATLCFLIRLVHETNNQDIDQFGELYTLGLF